MSKWISRVSCMAAAIAAAHASANPVIISEYIEGSSFNKAIELYNTSTAPVSLDGYALKFYFNGRTSPATTVNLAGQQIAGQATFVIAHRDAAFDPNLINLTSAASWFNGDDAIVLENNGQVIDSIGQIGTDPGSEWGTGVTSTKDNTLRRVVGTTVGDTVADDPFFPSVEWEGFAKDDASDLGLFAGNGGGDTGGNGGDTGGNTGNPFACASPATAIHAIQGAGDASALEGEVHEVEGVVTQVVPGLDGFFIQMPDAEVDGDSATSEGVFVYSGNAQVSVQPNVGERIRLNASVSEYFGKTQLTNITAFEVCQESAELPSAATISLPVADTSEWEQWEGMRVAFDHPLVVNETYNLGRYGTLMMGKARAWIPTQVARPGAAAKAVHEANARDRIFIDDASNQQNPAVIPFPAPQLSATNTVRVGDVAQGVVGALDYSFGDYKVMPESEVSFSQQNPRTSAPELLHQGNLKVASFNVLNYFNGDGQGGGFPTARGADNYAELQRQEAKIVAALVKIDADIVGLMEIENDGFGANSAIASLTQALNAVVGEGTYSYVTPSMSRLGDDAIAVGLLYKPAQVNPFGAAQVLSTANSPLDGSGQPLFLDSKNRPALAQTFSLLENGGQLTVVVNHLKSKGSSCDALGDPNLNDGQGNCNQTRTRAAQALAQWLPETFGAEQPTLIIGDLNAYAKEDPIAALEAVGYENLSATKGNGQAYSYVFSGETGQLDHALGNMFAAQDVVNVVEWHINTDEPRVLDYNTEYKTADQISDYYASNAFRSSDHDPVIIEMNLQNRNLLPVASFTYETAGTAVNFTAVATDEDGTIASYEWEFGPDLFAYGEQVSFDFAAPGEYPVTLRVTDDKGGVTEYNDSVVIADQSNQPPVAAMYHGSFYRFHWYVSTSSDVDGEVVSHQWSFSDGREATGDSVFIISTQELGATLTVTDDKGATSSTVHTPQ